jgi:large subunit ribosomal protein L4
MAVATELKKFNLQGKQVGAVAVDQRLVTAEANSQMIKDYIVAIRENARQWSANTKGRSEGNHSTKKPHAQKGGGRSRQGSLSAPQYKGGGRAFGPKPKFDQHVRINRKERQAAIRALLAEKIQENKMVVLESSEMQAPKTKTVSDFIEASGLNGKVLFLGEGSFVDISVEELVHRFSIPCDTHEFFIKSIRNIEKAQFKLATNICGYDVVRNANIVITEAALKQLEEWLLADLKGN